VIYIDCTVKVRRFILLEKIKVIVADDSNVYREILIRAVKETDMADVLCDVSNGRAVVNWIKYETADVVLLDVFMPEMDGLEALKIIKRDYPNVEVIMISSNNLHSADLTLEALNNGAVDFILKPSESDWEKSIEIIKTHLKTLFMQIMQKKSANSVDDKKNGDKKEINKKDRNRKELDKKDTGNEKSDIDSDTLKEIQSMILSKSRPKEIKSEFVNKFDPKKFTSVDLILVASSTGGPSALDKVFSSFDSDFNVPVLVVQHMPPKFTQSLSESLDKKCKISVKEGRDNDLVKNGQVIIAPGGYHMVVKREGGNLVVKTETTPYVNGVRPSADVLFKSVAEVCENKNILVVVLTGMGSDGKDGIIHLKQKCNCYCITQSEKSCVVYGMPKSVNQSGLSDEMIDLDDISKRIQDIAAGKGILQS